MKLENEEILLKSGRQRALVSSFGASLRRFFLTDDQTETDILWGYSGTKNKNGGQGDVLIPFPSRIRDGKYSFQGKSHQLPINDKDGPNAIHGFLRGLAWKTEAASDTEAHFLFDLRAEDYAPKGFPFSLTVRVSYVLSEEGLTTSFEMKNVGPSSAPVGAGFHPYFLFANKPLADWTAKIPAKKFVVLENLVPTGEVRSVEGTPLDFRNGRRLGETKFNHTLAALDRGADGSATIQLTSPGAAHAIELILNRSFDYVVVYSGDQIPEPNARRAFAIEPLTCATDALNHPDWGLRVLNTGQSFAGSYRIRVRESVTARR